MALHKIVPTEFGVDALYWQIAIITDNVYDRVLEVVLYGYAQPIDDSGSKYKPIARASAKFAGEDYQSGLSIMELYEKIRTVPEWGDAEHA